MATPSAPTARFGTVVVVAGPDAFLGERAVAQAVAQLRAAEPESAVTAATAGELTPGRLMEMTGADLFAPATVAVIRELEKLPPDLAAPLLAVAGDLPEFVALIVHHGGSAAGLKTLGQLKKQAGLVIDCPTPKWARDWADFVRAEVQAGGGTIEPAAVPQLIEAVGQDSRALAAAVAQLLSDSDRGAVAAAQVKRYFAGRASVTSFAVADACLAGRTGDAIEKARWALATGAGHPQITSALATALRQLGKYLGALRSNAPGGELAKLSGAPEWKLRQLSEQARSWGEPAVGRAIRLVAQADAEVKGAAGDPDFALEQALIKISRLRRA
ncbi:MAG: DNA polymerase III subunit delta [Propionibacteriaceae bacterium]|jgi:DNA polymerase-3 subunit delta|nr:DNA polymerase III subunit delta [Propionibacteriaceae bacterium]